MSNIKRTKIGFIGGGKMAEAIIKGLRDGGVRDLVFYDRSSSRTKYIKKEYKIKGSKNNTEVVKSSDVILLAVKPGDAGKVARSIKADITKDKLIVSVAAGISMAYLRYNLGTDRIIRVMPNTPAFVGKGITAIAASPMNLKKDITLVQKIFESVGDVILLDEKYIDAVTALSGSGPAFVSLFVESLIDGAVRMGLNRADALTLALSTVEGSIEMLKSGISTSKLRDMVTSPGGTTAEGLFVLERDGFKGLIIDCIESACEKAAEISQKASEGDE
ncbi:MAG: pyrroline-5-carboxylate reductase [Nitrospirota bacterium]|nr:MAG: pyrroline-5-carboxylate reductase [Nitrospirota bacterium]